MGTETHCGLPLDTYIALVIVKLNNPLMGTETFRMQSHRKHHQHHQVKLNNPLMGTETYNIVKIFYNVYCPCVKLNNPLMGTETETLK